MKKSLSEINEKTIKSAGARYTPVVDPGAPNLAIEPSINLLDALSLNQAFRERLRDMASRIEEAWPTHLKLVEREFRNRKQTPPGLAALLRELADQKPGTSVATTRAIYRTLRYCRERLVKIQRTLHADDDDIEEHSEKRQSLSNAEYDIRKLSDTLYEVAEFQESPEFQCILNNKLLLRGAWGTGKTHFLCDITRDREGKDLPTLMVLARSLQPGVDPLEAICERVPFAKDVDALLARLDLAGRKCNSRALVIVDGINESDRAAWTKAIPGIVRKFGEHDHVALVLSCRTPFEFQMFSDRQLRKFVQFVHPGFSEIAFDAQNEYFSHYDIPTPEVPILVEEFSRPLFLKILCESLNRFSRRTSGKKIGDMASGQKSMTTIFENFIKTAGKDIENFHNLPGLTCWRILKGKRINGNGETVGVAVAMADRQADFLGKGDVVNIIRAHTGRNKNVCEHILERMIRDGLVSEDMMWREEGWIDAIRMPYQRFSDHLICRHLLDRHLKTDSQEAIKRSFYRNRPLGKIFELDDWGRNYKEPGIASALMLEFPERLKRVAPAEDRELIGYLPRGRRLLSPFVDAFLDGLIWRDAAAFSCRTYFLTFRVLKHGNDVTRRKTLDTLVCLASRPAHSETAAQLEKFLDGLGLIERDRLWSEYLRKCGPGDTPYRILRWVEANAGTRKSSSSSSALICVLEWFLTTTHKSLRDRATRALVLIGEENVACLFERTLSSLARNDPYISERMLAASYGVLMRRWWGAERALAERASCFARSIFDLMFERGGKHRTKYVLAREHALGVIHLSLKMSPRCLRRRNRALLRAPFSSFQGKIPSAASITDEECADADAAIHMDFGNYTIGRLVEGRRNYDNGHVGYKNVRRQIEWRINDLGYRKDLFSDIDEQIARGNFHIGRMDTYEKVDRYGKKYSWIAFYEVAGMVQDRNVHGTVLTKERISDTDIDPSFPDKGTEFQPRLKRLFPDEQSPEEWVGGGSKPKYGHLLELDAIDTNAGPWVLLDGYIGEEATEDAREAFTFLRGVLVAESLRDKLVRSFRKIGHAGIDAIPRAGEDHYTFAGEVAWSPRFGNHLFDAARSTWSRHVEGAFSTHRVRKIRKPFGKLDSGEKLRFVRSAARRSDSGGIESFREVLKALPTPDEIVEVEEYGWTPGVEIEVPVWSSSWESYHSSANQGGGFDYPAPALCEFLGLNSVRGEADLVDKDGIVGSVFRVLPESWKLARGHFVYLRKDLLVKYLRHTNQELVWLMWGERGNHYSAQLSFNDIWKENRHIHRRSRKFSHD